MDAGKINSLIHNLRSGDGGARPGNAQSEAAFAARIAAAVVVDDLLQAMEGDAPAGTIVPPPVSPAPRSGVVVNLSTGVVAAEMASRAIHTLARPAEHAKTKADTTAAPEVAPSSARIYALTERLGESLRTNTGAGVSTAGALAEDRRLADVAMPFSAAPQVEPRAEVFALIPPPGIPLNRLELAEPRSSATAAIEQARESERLAGLNAKAEAPVFSRWLRLDRLALAAIVLGLVLLILL